MRRIVAEHRRASDSRLRRFMGMLPARHPNGCASEHRPPDERAIFRKGCLLVMSASRFQLLFEEKRAFAVLVSFQRAAVLCFGSALSFRLPFAPSPPFRRFLHSPFVPISPLTPIRPAVSFAPLHLPHSLHPLLFLHLSGPALSSIPLHPPLSVLSPCNRFFPVSSYVTVPPSILLFFRAWLHVSLTFETGLLAKACRTGNLSWGLGDWAFGALPLVDKPHVETLRFCAFLA